MKEYIRKDPNLSYKTDVVFNDPLHGFARKIVDNRAQIKALNQGVHSNKENDKNETIATTDTLLSERFNPNNKELNKERF